MKKNYLFSTLVSRKKISRKQFLKICAGTFSVLASQTVKTLPLISAAGGTNARKATRIQADHDLVVARGEDPFRMTVKAIRSMGGMEKFVKKGSTVVIKPNIGWDRSPEQAANTNPLVIAALVELCYQAGARRVNVFDITCNDPRRSYANSGIQKAAEGKGASVYIPDDWNMIKAQFSYKSPMEKWEIFRDALVCDTFINVPVLKHHSLTNLTLSIKNLMGVCGGNRSTMHSGIGRKLADLADFIKPDLTVIDAYRVLMKNGPSGGRLEDVALKKVLIAGTDPVLTDAYACTLVDHDPLTIPSIKNSVERNRGSIDFARARIEQINTTP